jgi:hypothetical protein
MFKPWMGERRHSHREYMHLFKLASRLGCLQLAQHNAYHFKLARPCRAGRSLGVSIFSQAMVSPGPERQFFYIHRWGAKDLL